MRTTTQCRALRAVAGVSLVLLAGAVPASSDSIERGDRAWMQRAGDFLASGQVPAEPVESALSAWLEALEENPEDLELRFKVMEALYFKGYFVAGSEAESREGSSPIL